MKKSLLTIIFGTTITATTYAQILQPANASFENWDTEDGTWGDTYQEPSEWSTGNECSTSISEYAVEQSSDAYIGSSSAKLETKDGGVIFGIQVKVNGVITTANMICTVSDGGQEGGSPYTVEIPDSIVGYYKYTPANNDSAYSQIMFLANNDMDTISYTRVNFTETVTEWTRFSSPLTPAIGGASPEKLSLFFSSSWGDGAQGEAEIGSVFFIDGVEFIQNPLSVEEVYNSQGWDLYPNPASDDLTIKGNVGQGVTLEVLDITGKQVKFEQLTSNSSVVDVNDLVPGIYLYQIQTLDRQTVRTGKLIVNP